MINLTTGTREVKWKETNDEMHLTVYLITEGRGHLAIHIKTISYITSCILFPVNKPYLYCNRYVCSMTKLTSLKSCFKFMICGKQFEETL